MEETLPALRPLKDGALFAELTERDTPVDPTRLPVESLFDPATVPAAFPALVPAPRFASALAAWRALGELSRELCPVALFPPARCEEAVVPLARVAGSTLLNLPSEPLKWLEK